MPRKVSQGTRRSFPRFRGRQRLQILDATLDSLPLTAHQRHWPAYPAPRRGATPPAAPRLLDSPDQPIAIPARPLARNEQQIEADRGRDLVLPDLAGVRW